MSPFETDPILVEVVRNGFVESVHHGRVVVTNPDGGVETALGEPFAPIYPRSSSKPMQAVGMLAAGLDLDAELLAVVCASHSGEPIHVEAVRRVLAGAGLDESALQTPPDWPVDEVAKQDLLRSGGDKSSILMNCSGKHSGMLATAVANGWPTATYRDPDHPVQLAILRAIDDLSGEQAGNPAIDGCGAPLFSTTLAGLARAFGRIAAATDGPEGRVRQAIRDHPEYVSGTRRDERDLIAAVPGLIAKAGAESVYAAGLEGGWGIAVKISDGGPRARSVVMASVVGAVGGADSPVIAEQTAVPVLGHGEPVGVIRPSALVRDL